MYVQYRPTVHVQNEVTYYRYSVCLKYMKSACLFSTLLLGWIDIYVSLRYIIKHHYENVLWGKRFNLRLIFSIFKRRKYLSKHVQIMSVVDLYRVRMLCAYSIDKREVLDTTNDKAVQMAVEVVNNYICPHGLAPNLIVYGSLLPLGLQFDKP